MPNTPKTLKATKELTPAGKRAAESLARAIQVFRDMDADMPVGELYSFLLIACGHGKDGTGLTLTEMKDRAGFALSTASRHMKSLNEQDRHGREGLRLITDYRDDYDERRKVLRLSDSGIDVINSLQLALGS